MTTWEIRAYAEGSAVVVVEAANEDEACDIAYREHLCGIQIEGGTADWHIEDISEVQ